MSVEVITIDRDMLDHVISLVSTGIWIIVTLIGALIGVHQRLISRKISNCNEVICEKIDNMTEYTHETRRLVYDSHNRITSHIDTHHTRKDP